MAEAGVTHEEIIKLAREANIKQAIETPHLLMVHELARFAALVAAAERQECAKICADIAMHRNVGSYGMLVAHTCANEILERGSA